MRTLPALALLALLLGAHFVAPATAVHAAEDGGTVSVFSQGSNSRALAQGGAVLTRFDDPSAWMWNPAGIGLVTRMSLQLEQASPTVFDYRESSGGFVLPSWRFGAFAMGYRQFGVDGIDSRDSRNAVIATELSDRQSEFSLGYGHAFAGRGSVGAVLRARRHELAGRSANAFAADVGVLFLPGTMLAPDRDWARDLSIALVSHNLLQPSIRLDLEDVADPRATRFGVGYTLNMRGGRPARIEVDLDATEGRSARLRTGIEFSAHRMLDLRFGTVGGSFTSGTGLHLRHLELDYAFEAGPANSAHRVGLGMRFGQSVDDSRASEERKRDEELDARLAKAFEARRASRLEELLQEARNAHANENPAAALEALGTARALEPNDPRIPVLEAAYLLEQATHTEKAGDLDQAIVLYTRSAELAMADSVAAKGADRCRALSAQNAARSETLQNRYASALRFFASGDLMAARRELALVVAARPDDAEAQRMLATVDRSIDVAVDQALAQASRLLRVNAYDESQHWLDEARALQPDSPRISAANAALARARQLARADALPKPAAAVSARRPRELSASERAEVEKLWRQGQAAMQAGRADEAVRYWELVRSKDTAHARAGAALKREYLNRGMDSFAAGRLPEAIAQWESALRIDPSDDRARAYLARAQEHLARTSAIGSR